MESQIALTKINLQGFDDVFLLSEYVPEKKLALKVLDIRQNKSYTGQASEIDLRSQAARIRLTYKDFVRMIVKAFFEISSEECSFLYCLDEENRDYMFKWKSIDHEETVINLGCIPMSEQNYIFVLTEVLLTISKEMYELNLKMKTLNSDLDESKNQTKKALEQLDEAVKLKKQQEREMFNKFMLVLNEKKEKIRKVNDYNGSKIKTNCKVAKPMPHKSKPHLLSSSEEEEAGNTVTSKPGTSKSLKRSSLGFFDDTNSEPTLPVKSSKIRNRKQVNKRKSSSPDEVKNSMLVSNSAFDNDSDEFLIGNL